MGKGFATLIAMAAVWAAPAHAAGLSLAPAFSGSVSQPMYVTAPPGDSHRLFVVTRPGVIRVAVDGVLRSTPFLDISSRVKSDPNTEAGMLSMAFPSDYATSGNFYVYFVQTDGHIRIEEFTRSGQDANVADPNSSTLLLDIPHPTYTNHYGGQLQWGPDGKLYAGTGDGGGSNDPNDNAQNPASMLGKLLAIDPSNPGSATVAALGLRNPFRWSFDRTTRDLVIGDVGQSKWEEIDYVPATTALSGLNFGWPCREGTDANPSHVCTVSSAIDPVDEYGHSGGRFAISGGGVAITGGVVVRDPALTPLFGRYLYADYFKRAIRSQLLATPSSTDDRLEPLPDVPSIVAFGEDADGHVYVVSLDGSVQRIVYTPDTSGSGDTPPATTQQQQQQPSGKTPAQATPSVTDTTAPRLTLRAARLQDVLRRARVRLSVACDESCIVRVSGVARGLQLRGGLRRIAAGKATVFELRVSPRIRRALARRGAVALTVRARDASGNLRTAPLTVRVKR